MVKTTVYLDDRDAAALRRLAAETGRSQADIIREAISKTTEAMGPRRLRSAAVGHGDGDSIARRADEIVREELGRSKRWMVDAGALYGVADANDPDHPALVSTLEGWPGELVVSAFTAAEADHLILTRLGIDAELALLEDLAATYSVRALDPAGLKRARELCARYRALELGLADASIVVLADQLGTNSIATFDQRHFRAIVPLQGGAFELLPTDAGD